MAVDASVHVTVELTDFTHRKLYNIFQIVFSNYNYVIPCVSATHYSAFFYFLNALFLHITVIDLMQFASVMLCVEYKSTQINELHFFTNLPSCILAVGQRLRRSAQRPPRLWQCYTWVADLPVHWALVLGHHCQTSSQWRWTTGICGSRRFIVKHISLFVV